MSKVNKPDNTEVTFKYDSLGRFNVIKNNGINQTWDHSDGSEVRIHAYGNKNAASFKSANNAHVHKQDPSKNQLNDRGAISTNKN